MAIFLCAVLHILVANLFYTQQFVSLNSLPHLAPPSPLSPLITTNLFSISVSLFHFFLYLPVCFLFQVPHISDIIQYLSLSVLLISLSIIHSRCIHVVANGIILFFFMAVIFHCIYIYHIFLIHSSVDGLQVASMSWLL